MNTALYSRQQALSLDTPSEAIVIGLGGTGTWTALLLAMSGVRFLHLMDFDSLEESNLNRLPYSEEDLGDSKISAATKLLKRLRPDVNILAYGEANTMTLDLATLVHHTGNLHIFDCTDKIRIQRMVYDYARNHKIPYMRVGYDGTHITVTDYVTPFSTEDDDEGGYAVTPSWVCPAVIAAALAVGKTMLNTDQDISLDISEIGNRIKPKEPERLECNMVVDNKEVTITLKTLEEVQLLYDVLNVGTTNNLKKYFLDGRGLTSSLNEDLKYTLYEKVSTAYREFTK